MSEMGEATAMATDLVMEEAKGEQPGHRQPSWHKLVALTTLVLAMLAAVGSLFAGITAEEALSTRTKEAISFTQLEGDSVEVEVLKAKHEILIGLGETPDQAEVALIQAFEEEVVELGREVGLEEEVILLSKSAHLTLAVAVTILSVGITLCGAAIVIDQRYLWVAGLVFGTIGAIGLGAGLYSVAFSL